LAKDPETGSSKEALHFQGLQPIRNESRYQLLSLVGERGANPGAKIPTRRAVESPCVMSAEVAMYCFLFVYSRKIAVSSSLVDFFFSAAEFTIPAKVGEDQFRKENRKSVDSCYVIRCLSKARQNIGAQQ